MSGAWISLVTLGVSDLKRSTSFYEALGWRRAGPSNATSVFLQGNGMVLSLFGRKDFAADVGLSFPGTGAASFPSIALAANFETEREVDQFYEKAVSVGGAPIKPPEPAFWGGYSGYFTCPDGHLWEVAHNPYFHRTSGGQIDLTRPPSEDRA